MAHCVMIHCLCIPLLSVFQEVLQQLLLLKMPSISTISFHPETGKTSLQNPEILKHHVDIPLSAFCLGYFMKKKKNRNVFFSKLMPLIGPYILKCIMQGKERLTWSTWKKKTFQGRRHLKESTWCLSIASSGHRGKADRKHKVRLIRAGGLNITNTLSACVYSGPCHLRPPLFNNYLHFKTSVTALIFSV